MKKRLIGLAVLLALLMPVLAAAQSAVVDNGSDPASRLNMRAQPNRDAAVVGKFVSGTPVEILQDAGNGWAEVRIGSGKNSITGYMMSDYLRNGSSVNAMRKREVASPYGTPSVVLRDRPSNSYSAVGMLIVGANVTQIGASGDFCYVMTDDGTVGCLMNSELK